MRANMLCVIRGGGTGFQFVIQENDGSQAREMKVVARGVLEEE